MHPLPLSLEVRRLTRMLLSHTHALASSATVTCCCARRCTADVVFSLPAALLLHAGAALADAEYGPAFRALRHEAGGELDQRCLLVLALVLERCRGDTSAWAPYIAMLPEAYGALGVRARPLLTLLALLCWGQCWHAALS